MTQSSAHSSETQLFSLKQVLASLVQTQQGLGQMKTILWLESQNQLCCKQMLA